MLHNINDDRNDHGVALPFSTDRNAQYWDTGEYRDN